MEEHACSLTSLALGLPMAGWDREFSPGLARPMATQRHFFSSYHPSASWYSTAGEGSYSTTLEEWDVELIQSLFWPDDSNVILQIPLSCVGVPDLLIWHYSTTGLFTVRSAYHLALSLAVPVGASTERWSRRMWQKIWQAHVPNKAKIFMWRAIRNILPTSTNLQKRIPLGTFCCPFCEHEAEQPPYLVALHFCTSGMGSILH
ncbi:UNVERIFIED_CONTAM: hypothetical protein Sradi_6986400 [Sesamum radiatum]|uniref:Reverse transcriptase zinc-binding domain-containing protein n=1 Tax=Sesamum radiatum TaxID=300843 RepID=A0AAW2JE82_SESRA